MGFSKKVKDEVLVKSARHCCVCHKRTGLNIEVHHIIPLEQGGKNTIENAIALCFDCHADAGHYFAGHPKGTRVSPEELRMARERWFVNVEQNNIVGNDNFDLSINNNDFTGSFKPIFIKESTRFLDRNALLRLHAFAGKSTNDVIKELKKQNGSFGSKFYSPFVNQIKTYDDYIDFLNDEFPNKKLFYRKDEMENSDCQPIIHFMEGQKRQNLSNCLLSLRFSNFSSEALDTYKIYLTFENVVSVAQVSKRTSFFDSYRYNYNIKFIERKKAEFIPEQNILVQNDSIVIDELCFRTHHETKSVIVKWEMFAKNVNFNGQLILEIEPCFENQEVSKYVENAKSMDQQIRYLPYII